MSLQRCQGSLRGGGCRHQISALPLLLKFFASCGKYTPWLSLWSWVQLRWQAQSHSDTGFLQDWAKPQDHVLSWGGKRATSGAWKSRLALGSHPTSSPALVPTAGWWTAALQDVVGEAMKSALRGFVSPFWDLLSMSRHHIVMPSWRPAAHAGSQRPLNLEVSPKPSLCPQKQRTSWENFHPAQRSTSQRGQPGSPQVTGRIPSTNCKSVFLTRRVWKQRSSLVADGYS